MLSFLALGILSAPAVADDRPTIAVVGIHQDDHAVDGEIAASAALAARIDAAGKFDALDYHELARRIAGREAIIVEEAVLGPGRRMLDDGRLQWSQAQPDQAVPALQDAAAALREGMVVGTSGGDLWEAYMVLGVAQRDLADTEAMTEAWHAAVAAAPARNPDPAEYPPDVVSAYDAVRKQVMAEASTLEVDATGTGARVLLDGEPRGVAPVEINGVPPGEHLVVAVAPDGTRGWATVEIEPGASQNVKITLGPAVLGAPAASSIGRARQAGALYRALGARSQVDLVLLVGVVNAKVAIQLYSVKADAFSTPVEVPFEGDPTDEAAIAVTEVLGRVQADGTIPVGDTVPNAIPVDVTADDLLAALLLAPGTLPGLAVPDVDGKRPPWLVVAAAGAGVVVIGGIVAATAGGGGDHGTIVVGPIP